MDLVEHLDGEKVLLTVRREKYDIRKEIDSCADFKRKLSPGNLGKR